MKILPLYVLLSVFFVESVYSVSSQSYDEKMSSKKIFSFPLNIVGNNTLVLTAETPPGFKPGEDLGNMTQAGIIEFIPNNEDIKAWTEIITFMPFVGQQLLATTFVENMANVIKEKGTDFAVVKTDQAHTDKYDMAEAFMTYSIGGQPELLWIYGVSGPADAAIVQYTIRLPKQLKKEDLSPYIEKIAAFKNKYVKIVEGTKTEKDLVLPFNQDELQEGEKKK